MGEMKKKKREGKKEMERAGYVYNFWLQNLFIISSCAYLRVKGVGR